MRTLYLLLGKVSIMKITSAAYSTKGLVKKVNQDNILLKTFSNKNAEICFAVVCDGVGGLDCGEVASSFAVDVLSKWFEHQEFETTTEFEQNYYGLLQKLVSDINGQLYEMGKAESKMLGTTLTALLIINHHYYILHVGDTRIYKVCSKSIMRLTKDHTRYEQHLDNGEYHIAERTNKNILWQCVGGNKDVEPQITTGIVDGGTFLICSDGFRDEVTETELQLMIGSEKRRTPQKLKALLTQLIELNLERNEKDNISAILIDVEID